MLKKILVGLGLVIVLIIAVLAILTFVTSTDFAIERETTINKPKDEVFAYAKMLKNQNEWGPWFKQDPAMKQEYRGVDGTPGFVSSWVSETVGTGEQEIKSISDGERIETEIRFKAPFESTANVYFTTESAGENTTKVKWGFTSTMPRPMNLMTLFLNLDDALGKDYEQGLANLKSILESQ